MKGRHKSVLVLPVIQIYSKTNPETSFVNTAPEVFHTQVFRRVQIQVFLQVRAHYSLITQQQTSMWFRFFGDLMVD